MQELATSEEMAAGPSTPHVAFCGNVYTATRFYVVAEGQCLLVTSTFDEAVFFSFIAFYVLWIEYPKKCRDTYLFLQLKCFEIGEFKTAVVSLKRFIDKLSEL